MKLKKKKKKDYTPKFSKQLKNKNICYRYIYIQTGKISICLTQVPRKASAQTHECYNCVGSLHWDFKIWIRFFPLIYLIVFQLYF